MVELNLHDSQMLSDWEKLWEERVRSMKRIL